MISDIEHLFTCLLAICISFLEKVSIQILCSLKVKLFYLFVFVTELILFIFWILTFIGYTICMCFLPFSRLPFHFVDGFLCYAETFQFGVVPVVYFCFFCLCFLSQIQKFSAKAEVNSLSPESFSRCFMASGLIF